MVAAADITEVMRIAFDIPAEEEIRRSACPSCAQRLKFGLKKVFTIYTLLSKSNGISIITYIIYTEDNAEDMVEHEKTYKDIPTVALRGLVVLPRRNAAFRRGPGPKACMPSIGRWMRKGLYS